MWFATSTQTRSWALPDGRTLLLQYQQSFIILYAFAHHQQWFIISDKRSEDVEISREDALKLLPAGTRPIQIPFFERYGIFIIIGLLTMALILPSFSANSH